jgi:tRNA (mo5U34)-methyltransferase
VSAPAAVTDLSRQIADREQWYHTLELAPGLETPGWFDLREIAKRMPIPTSLAGKRCLDVGTFDGFWAFEMERRGAAEVLAIDILDPHGWDWPADHDPDTVAELARRKGAGDGFEIAKAALGSKVERRELSIYDLDRSDVGSFDVVYVGSLLLHLRDPVLALERVRTVCDGVLVACDAIDATRTRLHPRLPIASLDGRGRPWWWKPNLAGFIRMVESAGYQVEGSPVRLRMKPGAGYAKPRLTPRSVLSGHGRTELANAWVGDPHAAVLARPTG